MSKMSEQYDLMDIPQSAPKTEAAAGPVLTPVELNLPSTTVTPPPVVSTSTYLPIGEEATMLSQWASMVASSPYYTKAGGKAGILSMWLCARELGIPPMQALNGGLYYVQGCVTMSSRMMNTLIRQRGHSIQKIQGNSEICHLRGKRRDNGDVSESIFTMSQALNANLTKNPVWKSYPERMLFNRALSNLAKDLFTDCIGTAYVEGEMDDTPINTEEPKEKPISQKTAAFIDKHNLLHEDNDISKFIDRIASTLSKDRIYVISDAAKDEEKFLASFEKFKKKK